MIIHKIQNELTKNQSQSLHTLLKEDAVRQQRIRECTLPNTYGVENIIVFHGRCYYISKNDDECIEGECITKKD
tara:strand:- start:9168 stop:9389 length:222 start_codon:yes stop_codon:yes gene_type:complete